MIVSFPANAGLVTILDPADVEQALTGLLRVAAEASLSPSWVMAHRPGQVKLEQSARDDPDMDKIMVCVGLLYPYDQKPSSRGLREATATGNRSR